jgi:hypothetical protein
MNPLPPAVAARWARNWSPEAHPERPWWCAVHSTIMSGSLVRWRRSDGRETDYYKVPVTWGTHDDPALFFVDTPRAELARIDAAHPLPHPGFYPGQTWADGDDEYHVLVICHGQPYGARVDTAKVNGLPRLFAGISVLDIPPRAILVYGPSQYGVVPWGPG